MTRGSTSRTTDVFIPDSASTVGAGKTGLTNASAGLILSVRRELTATPTNYSGANILAVSTVGTWLDPGAGKVRFGQVDATNQPGVYHLQFDNALFAASDASRYVTGFVQVTGGAPVPFQIELEAVNPQDAAAGGMTNLDAAISSRLATAGYTAPDNAGIDALEAALLAAIPELAAGAPPVTPTLVQAVMLHYMMLRNKNTQTDALRVLHNDAGTPICDAPTSWDGTTFTRDKLGAP